MGTPIWRGSTGLVEQPDSPAWSYGDNITVTRRFKGPYDLCWSTAPFKGATASVNGTNLRVNASTVTKERGGVGLLTIVYNNDGQPAQGAQLPADEVSITLEKQDRSLKKHPRYAGLSEQFLAWIDDVLGMKVTDSDYASEKASLQASTLGFELYNKLRSGQLTFVYYSCTYKLTLHYWTAPSGLTAGGFRQTPPSTIVVPPTTSAFGTYEWLREGDTIAWNGSTWQVTRSWIGAPSLDHDIYP